MKVFFLGTAAAEGYPAAFCSCDNCQRARQLGGRNLRRRSACLINDDLLIDFGPDIYASFQDNNLALWCVKYLLLTHAHDDHLLTTTLKYRRKKFALNGLAHLDIYGSAPALEQIMSLPYSEQEMNLTLHTVNAFQSWQMGPYAITSFEARHDPGLEPLFFSIGEKDKQLLYATDTGPFPEKSWALMSGMLFNAAIIEGTLGNSRASDHNDRHMTKEQCIAHHKELWRRGLMNPDGINVAHHFSHNGNPPYADLLQVLNRENIVTAYDGLTINL